METQQPVPFPPPDGGTGNTGNAESTATVLVAGAANLGIAVAKAVGGLISGSGAMMSEAAHSLADTVTEVLLLTALKRSEKPADAGHPLGYGRERYIWAMFASVATFVGGAVFSVTNGIHTLTHGEDPGNPLVSYLVLALAFLLEGSSLLKGLKQARGQADRHDVATTTYLQHTPDTTVKAVVLEDSAALIGLVLAAGGLLGGQLTGSGVWDGISSLCIGALLAWVALVLGRANATMLIGRSIPASMEREVERILLDLPDVDAVLDLVTIMEGPDDVLVAAKVDFRSAATAEEVEWACEDAEKHLRERFPAVGKVFLDPTPGPGRRRGD
ncbi:cation diffusion facilitator family transporter [Streptacidiphilus sp. N1-1]|uniref:Cation diffusion facilitator family transporter n=1 Tax=Streptacidiphilus alkalitolerans TaxID=3342712 RepID=A0ABV6VAM5_9ACTN